MEWISIDEQLPDDNIAVLCFMEYEFEDDKDTSQIVAWRKNGQWLESWEAREIEEHEWKITHWHPLFAEPQ